LSEWRCLGLLALYRATGRGWVPEWPILGAIIQNLKD
jgi:hypothetical protein